MFCNFFFQAEDGIRDDLVTGVQTCALPIEAGAAGLALADTVEAVGIDPLHSATDDFFQHLGIARQIPVVYEILCRNPAGRSRDTIAVAVINNRHGTAVLAD